MKFGSFRSNGKLLLTGEYVVLDGAMALTLPTNLGQTMEVTENPEKEINWKAFDHSGKNWFSVCFDFEEGKIGNIIKSSGEEKVIFSLKTILSEAFKLLPNSAKNKSGFTIITHLEFPVNWGLGSSSTLLNNIAQWLEIDAYKLLKNTFGGSGFDIAAAQNDTAITYQLLNTSRSVLKTSFNPPFAEDLFFVHLNHKQNSRDSIAHYKSQPQEILKTSIEKISGLTGSILNCDNLEEFQLLLEIHETIISSLVNFQKVKDRLFPDYPGAIKSLGGWGGDFILATGRETEKEYFRKKGYSTILSFSEMIKK